MEYLLACVSAAAIGLVLVWAGTRRRAPYGKDWVLVSTPTIRSGANAGTSVPAIIICVSNVGPRSVGFRVAWLECRAKRDRALLATNQLASVDIPLSAGNSTNLTIDIGHLAMPVEDCLCCCEILWSERESTWRRRARVLDRPMTRLFDILDLNWPPWLPQRLTNGYVFAANVDLAEYFRLTYGFTPTHRWFQLTPKGDEDRPQRGQPSLQPGLPSRISPIILLSYTADERCASDALEAYQLFCPWAGNDEPGGAANGSQPTRSETNQTSSAAGSRR